MRKAVQVNIYFVSPREAPHPIEGGMAVQILVPRDWWMGEGPLQRVAGGVGARSGGVVLAAGMWPYPVGRENVLEAVGLFSSSMAGGCCRCALVSLATRCVSPP
ncbi:exo-alpha-sialidase [Trypanosoma cruzi]|nr:exo-alpha-sialidase [Trypanosoma cruzi]